ncbi:MAG: efflux RND transporter periplasmic adaptor subunit [Verrucomicrobiaceae bacterium]
MLLRLSYPAVCLASLALITGCKPAATKATFAPPPPAVTVAKPIVKKVIDWDEFTGRLASPESVDIRARVSGYLEEVHFKEGTEVKAGDLLVTIDPRPYEAAVQRAQADVSSARSRAELAKTEAENAGPLLKSQAISSEENVRRLKAAAEANSAMKAAEAVLNGSELELEFTRIRSPINGRISDARVTKGNLVTGGTKDATLLTTVVSLDPIYCFIECDERSALKYREMYKLGTRKSAMFAEIPAQMALANQSGFPHQGHLDFVDNVLNPATGSIRARAVFENQDRLMSPGFFARVRIPGSGEYEGMLILDQAIADDQGRSFVWVIDADNKASYRPVVTGPLQDGMRVVREGLKAEDRVVINGLMSVRNGVTVVPQDAEMKLPVTK